MYLAGGSDSNPAFLIPKTIFLAGVLFLVNVMLSVLAKVPAIDVSADDLHSDHIFNVNCIAVIPNTIRCFLNGLVILTCIDDG